MPGHTCPHAQRIGALMETQDRLKGAIDGNGSKGLLKDVTILKTEVKDMNADLSNMATSLSALAKSQVEQDAIEKEKTASSDRRSKSIEKIGIFATIVFGIVGLIYVILNYAANIN